MSVKFQVRGTQLNAWYSAGGKVPGLTYAQGQAGPTVTSLGDPSVFGGSAIALQPGGGQLAVLSYPFRNNWLSTPGDFTVLFRIVPNWTGNPSVAQALWAISDTTGLLCTFRFVIQPDSTFMLIYQNNTLNNNLTYDSSATLSFTSGVATDIVITYTHSTHVWNFYQDGSLIATFTRDQLQSGDFTAFSGIGLGASPSLVNTDGTNFYINEFVLFDSVFLPSYPRSTFVSASNFDGSVYTDPGALSVENGVTYTFAGVSETGSLLSTDPGISNVLSGVTYEIANVMKTGTLVSTDPGISNVLNGTTYTINNVGKTGTLVSTDPGITHVQSGTTYTINNVNKTGTLVSTDPGISNVLEGITYTINNVAKTGTLVAVTNFFETATVGSVLGPKTIITITQGDTPVLQLVATDGQGHPVALMGAVFTSYFKETDGTILSIPNAQHTVNPDQVNYPGQFTVSLTADNTSVLGVASNKEILTEVVQGSNTLYYHGQGILNVLPAVPIQ